MIPSENFHYIVSFFEKFLLYISDDRHLYLNMMISFFGYQGDRIQGRYAAPSGELD